MRGIHYTGPAADPDAGLAAHAFKFLHLGARKHLTRYIRARGRRDVRGFSRIENRAGQRSTCESRGDEGCSELSLVMKFHSALSLLNGFLKNIPLCLF